MEKSSTEYTSRSPRFINDGKKSYEVKGYIRKNENQDEENRIFDFLIHQLQKGIAVERVKQRATKKFGLEIKYETVIQKRNYKSHHTNSEKRTLIVWVG